MGKFNDMLMGTIGTEAGGVLNTGLGLLLEGHEDKRQQRQQQALTEMQVKANKELSDYNATQQLKMWQATNYSAQMEELKKAGLNPGLIYGLSGGGATTTGGGAQTAVGGHAAAQSGEILGLMQMKNQNALTEAQTENIKADTENKKTQNSNITADTAVKQETLEQIKTGITNTKAQTALTKIQTETEKLKQTITDSSQLDQIRLIDLAAQKAQEEVNIIKNQSDISDETKNTIIKTTKQNYINAIIEGNLKKSNITVNNAEINKMANDIIQRGKEIGIKQFEATIKANYPDLDDVLGGMVNSIKKAMDKIGGLPENYTSPNQIKE